jgi:hypothetical protein
MADLGMPVAGTSRVRRGEQAELTVRDGTEEWMHPRSVRRHRC